ncbi:MAG: VWA domain-containing protein [Microscillaceae bacterium]|nr:VWA domain-containing protein [Microscillaceae bacterium]MDW8461271.1 VWA domain-containing protein [Cytophagales bacterium]
MEWLSWQWFLPQVLTQFEWENPKVLYLLPALPLIFALRRLINSRFRQKVQVALHRGQIKQNYTYVLRYIPITFLWLCLICLLIALARPQRNYEDTEKLTEGIDIMLVLDISESMLGEDLQPNRLAFAKQVATNFVSARTHDRIGIVVFAGEAFSLAPLTTDHALIKEYIQSIEPSMITTPGTAIGTAIGVATNRLRESESKTKVIILISDGDNRGGNLSPVTAAHLAAYHNIKLYTILVGFEGEVKFGTDSLGRPRIFKNTIDEQTLKELAHIGEGKFFRAADNQSLEKVFQQIDQYEKSVFTEIRYKSTKDFYTIYLSWAICFFLVWLLLKSTYLSNILED